MRTRSPVGTPVARALAAALTAPVVAAWLALFTGGGCSVGDQQCPDDTIDTDLDDACPYGPPGGPQKPRDSCPSITFAPDVNGAPAPECDGVTFESVFDIFVGPPGNCGNLACHGTQEAAATAFGVFLDPANPAQVYDELSKYLNGSGEPYMLEGNARSWILCNLKALPGGGSPMPKPGGMGPFPDELAQFELWVACGMKAPVGGGATSSTASSASSSSGGGAGGATGVGGAGGAGGAL